MGTGEGLMRIPLDCWETGEMHVGGTPSAINFAKRKRVHDFSCKGQ